LLEALEDTRLRAGKLYSFGEGGAMHQYMQSWKLHPWAVGAILVALAAAAMLVPLLLLRPASADTGDFTLDFAAAKPNAYSHGNGVETSAGALSCGAGITCSSGSTIRELMPQDFGCGDRVVFFTKVRVDPNAVGTQSLDLHYGWDAKPNGDPGAGYAQILAAGISGMNSPTGNAFAAGQASEPGNRNLSGNEDAYLVPGSAGFYPSGSTFGNAKELWGTVRVTGLDAGEDVVVRTDLRFDCYGSGRPTGSVHAHMNSAYIVGDGRIDVGPLDIAMKAVQAGLSTPAPSTTPLSTSTLTPRPTSTHTPVPTNTSAPVLSTATRVPPTATRTATSVPATGTAISQVSPAVSTPAVIGATSALPRAGDGAGGSHAELFLILGLGAAGCGLVGLGYLRKRQSP
jgi:hypothetical protein